VVLLFVEVVTMIDI